jgi:hypothetical protein
VASRPDPPLDAAAITAILAAHAVDYVLIGGVAVQAHGYTRATNDLDVVAAPELANLSRLGEALTELEARLARSARRVDLSDPHLLRRAPLIPIATKHGRLDLINLDQLPGAPRSYEDLRARAITARVAGHDIPVAGVDDLVRLKRAAGRESDLRDIAALTRTDEELERESRERDRSLELDPESLDDR